MNFEEEKEFFERFGADKIWVNPSKENGQTILDIWDFIHSLVDRKELEAIKQERERCIEKIKEYKILEGSTWQETGKQTISIDAIISHLNNH